MKIDNLVYMANQIGSYYASEPDVAAGTQAVATHIRKFWEPRMRRLIVQHVVEHNGEGLTDIVRRAIQSNQEALA